MWIWKSNRVVRLNIEYSVRSSKEVPVSWLTTSLLARLTWQALMTQTFSQTRAGPPPPSSVSTTALLTASGGLVSSWFLSSFGLTNLVPGFPLCLLAAEELSTRKWREIQGLFFSCEALGTHSDNYQGTVGKQVSICLKSYFFAQSDHVNDSIFFVLYFHLEIQPSPDNMSQSINEMSEVTWLSINFKCISSMPCMLIIKTIPDVLLCWWSSWRWGISGYWVSGWQWEGGRKPPQWRTIDILDSEGPGTGSPHHQQKYPEIIEEWRLL